MPLDQSGNKIVRLEIRRDTRRIGDKLGSLLLNSQLLNSQLLNSQLLNIRNLLHQQDQPQLIQPHVQNDQIHGHLKILIQERNKEESSKNSHKLAVKTMIAMDQIATTMTGIVTMIMVATTLTIFTTLTMVTTITTMNTVGTGTEATATTQASTII